ncbi:hypothetical protein [Microtetraspora niveoalba]|uniref:hypothetical protein n=1 Tax=Microtetraspora niveoalba TaxID=46175 RepID=UPI0012FCD6E1|nr:hypothetical protein [Microtetraspora niveoalba]
MPQIPDLLIRAGRVHGRDGQVDVHIRDGLVTDVEPSPAKAAPAHRVLEAAGGLVSRSFTEPHYHPDKAYSRRLAPPGLYDGFARARTIKAGFTVEDVADRATRALRLASVNGVTALRANVDVDSVAGLTGLHGMLAARERVAHLMDVQIVAFPQEGLGRDPGARELLEEALRLGAGLVGGWPNVEDGADAQRAHVREVFDIAERFAVDVDIHVDCMIDASETMMEFVAAETLRRGYQGRVLASHCCGLEMYDEADAARVVAAVAEAGLRIVIVPINLADGGPRGLSRPRELMAAGVVVAAGSDNMNDGWYALGTLDPLDRAQTAYHGAGFHDDASVDVAWDMVGSQASVAIGGRDGDVLIGESADLVVFDVPDRATALASMPGRRTTLRRGRVVSSRDTTGSPALEVVGA